MAQLSEVTLARVVRGGVLAGLGILILLGGEAVLSRFLSPSVALRAIIGAGVLLLLGAVELYRALQQAIRDEAADSSAGNSADGTGNHAGHHHPKGYGNHTHSDGGPIWALLLPLVMLPAAVNSSSANIATNRLFTAPDAGVPETASIGGPLPETAQESETVPPFDDGSLPDILYRLLPERGNDGVFEFESANFSLLPYVVTYDPDHLHGERVRLVGFVHKEKGWPQNSFVLGRLSIWCCTADASLVGMWISLEEKAPPAGTWLQIEGTVDVVDRLEFDDSSMQGVPALKDVSFQTVPQPKEEYTLAPAW